MKYKGIFFYLIKMLIRKPMNKNKGTIVVNLACGLDTRCYRNEGNYKKWYNIDLPDTINVRARFMEEQGPAIYQFAESAMDETWAERIEYNGEPVLVETMNPFIVKNIKEKSIDQSEAKFTWGVKNGKILAEKLPSYAHVADHSLVEGMAMFVPIYRVLKKIPLAANISNRIIVLRK